MRVILEPDAYRHVFERFRGKKVFHTYGLGNVGDDLIHAAERQLFRYYNITEVALDASPDAIFYGGGGNMGKLYAAPVRTRHQLRENRSRLGLQVPIVILPQSWTTADDFQAEYLFCREIHSLRFCPQAVVAPDCGLAYTPPSELIAEVSHVTTVGKRGVFFRVDAEKTIIPRDNICDPAERVGREKNRLAKYFLLAASFEEVHTNRLHFAIAAMILGKRVYLYGNNYFKNKGVYDLWLRERGCSWRDSGMLAAGEAIGQACVSAEVTEQSPAPPPVQCGTAITEEDGQLKQLEGENLRLKRLLAEAELDKSILKERLLRGNLS
jgi:putative transposase